MKGHKAHHHKHPRAAHKDGGVAEYKMDSAPSDVYAGAGSNVVKEAKERKRGGKAKHVGLVQGNKAMHHAGRKPRKSGGKVGADTNPLSSAHRGTAPKGRDTVEID